MSATMGQGACRLPAALGHTRYQQVELVGEAVNGEQRRPPFDQHPPRLLCLSCCVADDGYHWHPATVLKLLDGLLDELKGVLCCLEGPSDVTHLDRVHLHSAMPSMVSRHESVQWPARPLNTRWLAIQGLSLTSHGRTRCNSSARAAASAKEQQRLTSLLLVSPLASVVTATPSCCCLRLLLQLSMLIVTAWCLCNSRAISAEASSSRRVIKVPGNQCSHRPE